MKPVTIDMLRAHLLVASLTAAASNCARRWLVVLHLRLKGQPSVLAEH